MFENMKRSEKIMAGALACLVPIGLVFMFFYWYTEEYRVRKNKISNLDRQIQQEQFRKLDAINANLRRNYYYRPKSMPADVARAKVSYRDWLTKSVSRSGMSWPTITATRESKLRLKSGVTSRFSQDYVAKKLGYQVTTSGTLDELIKFCYAFESVDLLHNISGLKITPVTKNDTPTGEHRLLISIDVLSLADADEKREFLVTKDNPQIELADYEEPILKRNIFGLANNPPTLSLRNKNFDVGEDFSFTVTGGRDPDKDELTYELIDNGGLDGLELDTSGKSPKLVGVAKELGEYTVLMKVTDSGYPQKSVEDDFKITVEEPKVVEKKEKKKDPPPPPFVNATKTKIKRISSRRSGNAEPVFTVKIDAMTLGQKFELSQGGKFELDDKIWVVKGIDIHTLTLEVDGKELQYEQGDFLSEPRVETELEQVEAPEVSKITD